MLARFVRAETAYALLLVMLFSLCVGCSTSKKRRLEFELLDADTLYARAEKLLAQRELSRAKEILESMRYTRENQSRLEPLVRLRLADVAFYTGNDLSLIDARSMYLNFGTLYTDHPLAPYAQLQAGVCSLRQANNPARDQSETNQAILDFKEVIRRYPDSPYAVAARDRVAEAETTLAEHEFLVGRFYLKRNAFTAAAARFKIIVEDFPRYPEKEKLYFHLGKSLVLGGDGPEGEIWLDRLLAEFPTTEFLDEAEKLRARAARAAG